MLENIKFSAIVLGTSLLLGLVALGYILGHAAIEFKEYERTVTVKGLSEREYDADIVIGEGRALGNPMDYGGSSLGLFACKKDYLRQMPGRVIGLTKDVNGKNAFCMSFQTREQHIRRGRATSNICTNEGLNALTACVYLSWLGNNGIQKLSYKNFENGQKLAEKLESIDGFEKVFSGTHFNEFLVKCPVNPLKIHKGLLKKNIHSGLIIEDQFPELKNTMLFGISEIHSNDDIDYLVSNIKEVI